MNMAKMSLAVFFIGEFFMRNKDERKLRLRMRIPFSASGAGLGIHRISMKPDTRIVPRENVM